MSDKVKTTITIIASKDTTASYLATVKLQYMNKCQAFGDDCLEVLTQVEATPSPSLTIDQLDDLLRKMEGVDSSNKGFIVNAACELIGAAPKYSECEHCMIHFIPETSTSLCKTCTPLYHEGL